MASQPFVLSCHVIICTYDLCMPLHSQGHTHNRCKHWGKALSELTPICFTLDKKTMASAVHLRLQAMGGVHGGCTEGAGGHAWGCSALPKGHSCPGGWLCGEVPAFGYNKAPQAPLLHAPILTPCRSTGLQSIASSGCAPPVHPTCTPRAPPVRPCIVD